MTERWNNLGNNVDSPQRATYESFWKKSHPSTYSSADGMEWNCAANADHRRNATDCLPRT
ncbi:hypothetical protein V3C99_016628 [Haemonchus contortus]